MHETEWMWKDTKLIWANTLTILGAEATKRNLEHEILCSSPSIGGKLRMWLGITRISVVKVKSQFVSLSTQIWIVPIWSTSAPESPYIIIIWLICITLFSFFFLVVGRWKAESNFISYVERTSESDAKCVRRLRWKKRSEESHDLDVIKFAVQISVYSILRLPPHFTGFHILPPRLRFFISPFSARDELVGSYSRSCPPRMMKTYWPQRRELWRPSSRSVLFNYPINNVHETALTIGPSAGWL